MADSKKEIWSWSFYDWANSAFATTVIAGFFPVFYKKYWTAGMEVETSTLFLGLGNSIAAILVAFLAPFLGAIADKCHGKKGFLISFAFTGSISTLCLFFVQAGAWPMAMALFIIGNVGFSGANLFYDSLLPSIASPKKVDYVSSLGFALGYLGGGLLLLVNVIMATKPQVFGFATPAEGTRWSFFTVGIWWMVFTLPLILFVKEPKDTKVVPIKKAFSAGYGQIKETFAKVRKLKVVGTFLLAYWLYIDGVDTIIRMAVDYGISIGFQSGSLIVALLIVQFIAFPSALLYNLFAQKIGIKRALYVGIGAYALITGFGVFMQTEIHFYILAGCIGLFQGGIQALSRSLYTRLVPTAQSAEFFGFYNMLGKTAAIIGPGVVGLITFLTKSNRIGILSLIIFFVAGAWLLSKVDLEEGQKIRDEYLED